MAISIDALLAVVLFIALVAFISIEPASEMSVTQPRIAVNQIVDDAIAAMDSTGSMMDCLERSKLSEMKATLEALLPETIDYNVQVRQYQIEEISEACRSAKDFETCFPETDIKTFSFGFDIPPNKEVFHGRKIFIKKEPGDCVLKPNGGETKGESLTRLVAHFSGNARPEVSDVNISVAGSCPGERAPCPATDQTMRCCFDYKDTDGPQIPTSTEYKWYKYDEEQSGWLFTGETDQELALDETNDTNRFKCNVRAKDDSGDPETEWSQDVNSPLAIVGGPCFQFESNATLGGTTIPATEFECDQDYDVSFTITAEAGEREQPVDIMLAIDRSGSMSYLGRKKDLAETGKSFFIDSSGATDVAYIGTSNHVYKFDMDSETGGLTLDTSTSNINNAQGLFVDSDYVYVADDDAGLTILDKSLNKLKTIKQQGEKKITNVKSVVVQGNYIYLAAAGTYVPGTKKTYDTGAEMDSERNDDIRIGYNSTENWAAQSFRPVINDMNGVDIEVRKHGDPGDLTVHIREMMAGEDLPNGTLTIDADSIETSWDTWLEAEFLEAVNVEEPGEPYYIVLTADTPENGIDYYSWGSRLSSSNPYSRGELYGCTSAGSCTEQLVEGSGWDPDEYEDARFRIYSYSSLVGGLVIIDKTNPILDNWTILSNFYDNGSDEIDRPQDIFVSGNYAYLADRSGGDGTQGLWVVNVQDPSNPAMGGFEGTTNAYSVAVSGNYAYVTDRGSGLRVIDVSDKENPDTVTTVSGLGIADDVGLYGTNAYVNADTPDGSGDTDYGLHVIDISSPATASLQQTLYTQFVIAGENEYGLAVNENWVLMANNWETSAITFSRPMGHKMNIVRESSKAFVLFEDWDAPEDQIGVVSYGGSPDVNLNSKLVEATSANKTELNGAIDFIMAYGGTPMTSGLQAAVNELKLPPTGNGREDAMQFIILLADGHNDESGLSGAYGDARSNEIYVFTIGFGGDVDDTQMENIAKCAYCPDNMETDCRDYIPSEGADCGSYHHISDPEALDEVYELIAQKISELSGRMPDSGTAEISMKLDLFSGIVLTDYLPGVWNLGELTYSDIDIRTPWTGGFTAHIPCDYDGCNTDFSGGKELQFPAKDTEISFEIDDISQEPVYWPDKFSTGSEFYYNDLAINFSGGKFYGQTDTDIKYIISNEGYKQNDLSAVDPTVKFYEVGLATECEDATEGQRVVAIKDFFTDNLNALYGSSPGAGSDTSTDEILSNVFGSGWLCFGVWVNPAVSGECSENNWQKINCADPSTVVYLVDYWAWER